MTLLGCTEPRIWTPPARELTPKTSLGFEAVEFARDVLHLELFPWQEWLLIHLLELDPSCTASDREPLFRFDTVIVLVARQNGKTETMKALLLWKLYLDRVLNGRTTVIATAQDLGNSEKAWSEAVELASDEEVLAAEIEHVDRTNGKKALRLVGGHAYKVAAASRRGARGFTGDLVALDELREHQSWDAWGASTKTTLARPRSQVVGFSNAGDAASIVLWHLRAQAMAEAVGAAPGELEGFSSAPDLFEDEGDQELGTSLAIFEWSAPPKAGKWDRQAWAQANPSLGYSITERKIAAAVRSDPEWVFRTEVMCQWRPTAAGGPFPDGAWEAGIDAESVISPDSPIGVCIDVSHDRSYSFVAIAGVRPDGNLHTQVVMRRAGTEWVVPWLLSDDLAESRARWVGVTAQAKGAPVSTLVDELADSTLPWVPWQGSDLAAGYGQFYDLVRLPESEDETGKRLVFHPPQPIVDVPASTATTRPLGDGAVLDRRGSPVDCAPLMAEVGAVWLVNRPEEKPKHEPQVHEWPADLLTV